MSKKVIGHNTDTDGNSRCIKADYYKMGVANFLYHPNDGFTATCVIEYEVEDEQDSGRVNEHELNGFMGGHTKKKPKEIYLKQYPHGFNDGFEYHDVCPAITISSWQHNNFIIENYDTALGRRVDEVRAIGRERTEEEKRRRHLYGDKGAKFSGGKRMCILQDVSSCITTLPCKDNLIAEFYE